MLQWYSSPGSLCLVQAQTPCDSQLGLSQYNSSESRSQICWLQEHHLLMQAENQHMLNRYDKVGIEVL